MGLSITAGGRRTLSCLDGVMIHCLQKSIVTHIIFLVIINLTANRHDRIWYLHTILIQLYSGKLFLPLDLLIPLHDHCIIICSEKIEWRCYWLWSSWRLGVSCRWNLRWGCHTCFLACKSLSAILSNWSLTYFFWSL